jgi:hypothetical protein
MSDTQIKITFTTIPETSRVLNATAIHVTNGGLDIYRESRKIAHIDEGHWKSWEIVEANASIAVSVDGTPLRVVAILKDSTDSIG